MVVVVAGAGAAGAGAVGATLHQVNENASVEELRRLAATYRAILEEILA